jgi:type III restriction enzyme
VFEFLTQKRGFAPEVVRRQTAEIKELKGEDLLSDLCPIRVVITKDALREGWDCPFAYSLAILSRTTATTALTQMVGRILRQPYAQRTGVEALDRAYIYCMDVDVNQALQNIKSGLEQEGLGDIAGDIRLKGGAASDEVKEVDICRRARHSDMKILVPKVLHKGKRRQFRELDYERDILAEVDWGQLAYRRCETVALEDFDPSKRQTSRIDIADDERFGLKAEAGEIADVDSGKIDRPYMIRQLMDVVPNPWQGARILDEALAILRQRYEERQIARCKIGLSDDIRTDVKEQLAERAEAVFRDKVASGVILFKLVGPPLDDLNWQIEEVMKVRVKRDDRRLQRHGQDLQRSLFEPVYEKDYNGFEKDIAIYVDQAEAVHWWHRVAARRDWGLQGWLRQKVYPDFLIWMETQRGTSRLLAVEAKGGYLAGSSDTQWKQKLFEVLERAYEIGEEVGEVELLARKPKEMRFRMIVQPPDQSTSWKPELQQALDAA